MWFLNFLGTFLLSCLVYCLPVLIYRDLIRNNKPIENKWKAQGISWIFWICSYVAVCLFYLIIGAYDNEDFSATPGIPDFLCLLINWVILFYDKKKPDVNKPDPNQQSICCQCGAELPTGSKFCCECGKKIAPPAPLGSTVCPGCGCKLKAGRFCPECGTKLPVPENTAAPNQSSDLKHNPGPTILDNSSYKRKSNDTSPSNESPDDNSEGDSVISNLLGGIIVIGSLLFALFWVCLAFS